jgi:sterol desaturase/sphingolipid hydroxylase (fatty acid hydroxylase superfamily)
MKINNSLKNAGVVGLILIGSSIAFHKHPIFILATMLMLVLEYYYRGASKQEPLSDGFAQDSLWFLYSISLLGLMVGPFQQQIRVFCDTHLRFLIIPGIDRFPVEARLVAGFIVADLMAWCHHWLMHKVPWFWEFHKIHHSQTEVNQFTTYRTHPLELLMKRPIILVPLILLSLDIPSIAGYAMIREWHSRFYHANIKTNLGILRYIFVTPQSHRIHHSMDRRHFNMNLGVTLSIWDRLFGTQYRHYDEYPTRTGISDASYPMQTNAGLRSLIWQPMRQLFYPIKYLIRTR